MYGEENARALQRQVHHSLQQRLRLIWRLRLLRQPNMRHRRRGVTRRSYHVHA